MSRAGISLFEGLTELSFNMAGRVFRSAMPYCAYDIGQQIYPAYLQANVGTIALLTSDKECLDVTKMDLRKRYLEQGFSVIHLPISDLDIPSVNDLSLAVGEALNRIRNGENIAIHCHAGIGRTGVFIACMAIKAFGLSGDEAVEWVRNYIPGAIETERQLKFVLSFQ